MQFKGARYPFIEKPNGTAGYCAYPKRQPAPRGVVLPALSPWTGKMRPHPSDKTIENVCSRYLVAMGVKHIGKDFACGCKNVDEWYGRAICERHAPAMVEGASDNGKVERVKASRIARAA